MLIYVSFSFFSLKGESHDLEVFKNISFLIVQKIIQNLWLASMNLSYIFLMYFFCNLLVYP
jgi:hypothetical protein